MFESHKASLLSLPTELLQCIAICTWATKDVLALANCSSVLHGAIATSVVFQTRVREAGWDIEMWENEVRELSKAEALRLWIRADVSCGTVANMLSKARDPLCFERPDTLYQVWYPRLTFTQWDSVLYDCGEDEARGLDDVFAQGGHVRLIDGEHVWSWLTGFVKPFSQVLAHNDSNVSRNLDKVISLAGDGQVWQVILRVLLGLVHNRVLSQRLVILPSDFYPDLSPDLGAVLYNAFQLERFASTYAHFILSCDLADLERIFGAYRENIWAAYTARHQANNTAHLTHERFFGPWIPTAHEGAYAHTVTETRRFSSSFLCVATFFLDLHLSPLTGDSLSAPRLPSTKDVRHWMSLLPRHGLEGTPLAELPNDGGRRPWGGYYGFYARGLNGMTHRDPPMILELAVAVVQEDMIHLFGEGQDNVGSFTLSVRVARRTGLFDGIKSYTQNQIRWDWRGCVTPFGLVGRWEGGPVWIWPRDWSEE
ncbi:hypothetical protein PENSPDRAFT_340371 [Peniophora sp. CONT]|nr:hypothetical protein PENSPDRAFT_340371 [Peniophora sp. CONT]